MIDLARGVATHFTNDPASSDCPIWSPDSAGLIFASDRRGPVDLFWKSAAVGSEDLPLYSSDTDKNPLAWSADGRMLAFLIWPPHRDAGYWLLPLNGAAPPKPGQPVLVARGISDEVFGSAAFSPDSQWLAYSLRDASGE